MHMGGAKVHSTADIRRAILQCGRFYAAAPPFACVCVCAWSWLGLGLGVLWSQRTHLNAHLNAVVLCLHTLALTLALTRTLTLAQVAKLPHSLNMQPMGGDVHRAQRVRDSDSSVHAPRTLESQMQMHAPPTTYPHAHTPHAHTHTRIPTRRTPTRTYARPYTSITFPPASTSIHTHPHRVDAGCLGTAER